MTDQSPRDNYNKTEPTKATRNIPPLVWIILAILIIVGVIAFMQRKGADVTPSGGTTPAAAEGTSVMPAAPAQGDAPATPASTVNGPQQPAPN